MKAEPRGPGGAGVLFIMQRRDCTSPSRATLFHSTSSPRRRPLSNPPVLPASRPRRRLPHRCYLRSGSLSLSPFLSPYLSRSLSPEQRATVLRCMRRTGAKYNREAPRLMSRPNKAKNRPLNNARCNVVVVVVVGAHPRSEMRAKGRRFFRNFENREFSVSTCRPATSPVPSVFSPSALIRAFFPSPLQISFRIIRD